MRGVDWSDGESYRGVRAHGGAGLPRGWPRTHIGRLVALPPG